MITLHSVPNRMVLTVTFVRLVTPWNGYVKWSLCSVKVSLHLALIFSPGVIANLLIISGTTYKYTHTVKYKYTLQTHCKFQTYVCCVVIKVVSGK